MSLHILDMFERWKFFAKVIIVLCFFAVVKLLTWLKFTWYVLGDKIIFCVIYLTMIWENWYETDTKLIWELTNAPTFCNNVEAATIFSRINGKIELVKDFMLCFCIFIDDKFLEISGFREICKGQCGFQTFFL